MEALPVDEPPRGPLWQYEPKWDGFRCLVFRDGPSVDLQSKSGQPLARYFPELVETFLRLKARTFVLDGEIAIPVEGQFSFNDLLQRIHPAASRVRKLAAEHPAVFIAFDLLVTERGTSLLQRPLEDRRTRLETFARRYFSTVDAVYLSPATRRLATAKAWFRAAGGNLDGIVAKQIDLPYRSGERDGMQKIKPRRTVDCVVGGFRYGRGHRTVGSLLLGLYDADGLLHHVGFTSSFAQAERKAITDIVKPLRGPPGFTGKAPGGPSRWSDRASDEWEPLRPELVVEVEYDHFTGGRFRHGTRLLRWRPDKVPQQCDFGQLPQEGRGPLQLLLKSPAVRPRSSR
jgi:ATP-dependent DNA ligase